MGNKLAELDVYPGEEETISEYGYPTTKVADLRIENKIRNIKSINLSGDEWIITDELPGVYCQGIQYYDLKNIQFINNTGMAKLIELLKSLLVKGVEVKFVNVNEKIKNKIKSLGLDPILNCV